MIKEVDIKTTELVLEILKEYDISNPKNIKQNILGYVNKIYIFEHNNQKYILRESSNQKTLEHLKFEIEVLKYLNKQNFHLTPNIYPNKHNKHITIFEDKFYTLQNLLPGETKACWNDLSNFNIEMLKTFFQASAEFTKKVKNFSSTLKNNELTLFDYINNHQELFYEYFNQIPNSIGKSYIENEKENIIKLLQETKEEMLNNEYQKLAKQIVHYDIHPGNVNFSDNNVTGLFDFDWVRFDNRYTDLAATIAQSCWEYGGQKTGIYNKKRIQLGLQHYRGAFGNSQHTLEKEHTFLVLSMHAYLFFQLIWTMDWYKENNQPGDELVVKTLVNTLTKNNFKDLFS